MEGTGTQEVTDSDHNGDDASDEEYQADGVLSHHEATTLAQQGLAEVIQADPLLRDLPTEITLEEVNSQIALEHGQAMTIKVRRADEQVLPVVVTNNATVLDLKKAFQRHMMLQQSRQKGVQHISWRYVWKTYWPFFDGQKLTADMKQLKEYGIKNNSEVTFIKRLKQK